MDQVRRLVNEQLAGRSGKLEISRLLGTVNAGRGKMLRPGLVLLAGASCGRITREHIQVGAIIEIIHNATLLHDDVLDEGQKRRGEPTVNSLWGNEAAVVLGDLLLSRVFGMCTDLDGEVIRIIGGTMARICEGELRQTVQRRNWELSEPEYIDIVSEKSAALFACCCNLGGFLAGAGEAEIRVLVDFGLSTGIAFQIIDDLLDIVGDEGEAGKTLGSDIDKNKPTLAVIHLLREVNASERDTVINELSIRGSSDKRLLELLRSYGSLKYAQSRAESLVTKAIAALAGLEGSEGKEALVQTARFIERLAI
ncbi:MAG: polyprenyl synthetase family protein [Planctomycetota bacterium]